MMSFCTLITILSLATCMYITRGMTNEKQIFMSAPEPGMYNFFHLVPGGEVMVMTEYDLLLTLKQYDLLYKGAPNGKSKRKATADPSHKWTGCQVYYEITESLNDPKTVKVIREALDMWSNVTCLNFISNKSNRRRIQFRDGLGCYSQLGMQDKPQPISLATGCRTKGIIAHEIGHAIGFYHEHMRPDRDEFIKVHFVVIPHRFQSNFEKYNSTVIDTHGVPYDYTSLMHYGASVIPNSIETLDKSYQDKIGQREGLTFKDIKLANLLYKCAEVMHCKKRDCPEEGFQFYGNHKDKGKCQCWCDSGNLKDPLILCSDPNRPVIPPPKPIVPPTDSPDPTDQCMDMHPNCKDFKTRGQCQTEMLLMMDMCAKTCDFCGKGKGMCMDHEESCKLAKAAGLCEDEGMKNELHKLCPQSCGVCETPPPTPCDIQREIMGDDPGGHDSVTSLAVSNIFVIGLTIVMLFWIRYVHIRN